MAVAGGLADVRIESLTLGMPAFQGIVGSTPWNAMVFFTLYLQLLGMSDLAASSLMAIFLGGTALGERSNRAKASLDPFHQRPTQ